MTKHAIKQVDRLLSNEGVDIDTALAHWVPYVVESRTSINIAMDWTDFDADGHATIMLSLLTRHGRATPAAVVDGRHRNAQEPPQRSGALRRVPGSGQVLPAVRGCEVCRRPRRPAIGLACAIADPGRQVAGPRFIVSAIG